MCLRSVQAGNRVTEFTQRCFGSDNGRWISLLIAFVFLHRKCPLTASPQSGNSEWPAGSRTRASSHPSSTPVLQHSPCHSFGYVSAQKPPFRRCFSAFIPCFLPLFCLFLQNEPNSLFCPTHSFIDTFTFFCWVRLAETLFYRATFPQVGRGGPPRRFFFLARPMSNNRPPYTTAATPRPAKLSIPDSEVRRHAARRTPAAIIFSGVACGPPACGVVAAVPAALGLCLSNRSL